MSVEVQGHTVPHFKGLISGIENVFRFAFGVTVILCYSILKTAILLHKRGLVKIEVPTTVRSGGSFLTSPMCIFLPT